MLEGLPLPGHTHHPGLLPHSWVETDNLHVPVCPLCLQDAEQSSGCESVAAPVAT